MDKEKKIEEIYVNAMRDAIIAVMPKLTVHERRILYRFAYIQIEAGKHRSEAGFEKEEWPPVPQLTSRVKVLLRDASDDDVRRVFKLMRTYAEMHKKKE